MIPVAPLIPLAHPEFLTPLDLQYNDGRHWVVTKEFDYNIGTPDPADPDGIIRIPAGFITDFASIPRLLWNILPPTGGYGKAAVVHDYIYVTGGHIPGRHHIFTKKEADTIFLEAMRVLEVPWYQRYPMYQAVRWFGRGSF